jgi:peptide/nickel transport system permease protein
VILLVGSAVFAGLLPLKSHNNVRAGLLEPSLARPDIFTSHPLGTDKQGLDILASVIYGARVSLIVGTGAVLVGMTIGSCIGMAAGYYRGKVDGAISLLADAMLAFPPLILLLGMVSVLDPSTLNILLALALLGIPTYIRLSRANTMVFAQREFVLAAKSLGASGKRIIFRELLPNVMMPLVSYAFIVIGASIVAEAGLSFLGLGIQRPTPTWGNMIQAGQANFDRDPHLVFIPGIALFMTVFSFNRIGEKARKVWDPRGNKL